MFDSLPFSAFSFKKGATTVLIVAPFLCFCFSFLPAQPAPASYRSPLLGGSWVAINMLMIDYSDMGLAA
jgi:hypothetical protein